MLKDLLPFFGVILIIGLSLFAGFMISETLNSQKLNNIVEKNRLLQEQCYELFQQNNAHASMVAELIAENDILTDRIKNSPKS